MKGPILPVYKNAGAQCHYGNTQHTTSCVMLLAQSYFDLIIFIMAV